LPCFPAFSAASDWRLIRQGFGRGGEAKINPGNSVPKKDMAAGRCICSICRQLRHVGLHSSISGHVFDTCRRFVGCTSLSHSASRSSRRGRGVVGQHPVVPSRCPFRVERDMSASGWPGLNSRDRGSEPGRAQERTLAESHFVGEGLSGREAGYNPLPEKYTVGAIQPDDATWFLGETAF